jgi:hypothetical protein
MANLKIDLLNKLRNDKYYDEIELVRLAQEPNMNYSIKISSMSMILEKLATTNNQLALVEQYFQEPVQPQVQPQVQAQDQPVQQPATNVLPGQSHGE